MSGHRRNMKRSLRIKCNILLFFIAVISVAGCAPKAKLMPVEEALKTSLAKTRLSSPFTDDTGGVKADGYQLVTILTYHGLRENPRSVMHVTPKNFHEQMTYLKENNYNVISLREFFEFINIDRGLPEKSVVITFDDGWRSVYTEAYPILKKYGFPATIFIYTDFISPANKKALTWEMIKEMSGNGIDIQAHSKTHDMKIPWKKKGEKTKAYQLRLKEELVTPKKVTEKNLENTIHYIAYPYGQYTDSLVKAAEKYGYKGGLTVFGARVKDGIIIRKRTNSVFDKPFEVKRVQILSKTTLDKFIPKLKAFQPVKIYDGQYDHLFEIEDR